MKTHYVYELVNANNEVEYVGMSYRPEYRFRQHTSHKPSVGVGKFYGRTDLTLKVITGFIDKMDARLCEGLLQMYRGFMPDDEGMIYTLVRHLEKLERNNETD